MVKNRSIGLAILFSFLTCGIYLIYWFVVLADDVNEVTGIPGTSGGMALLYTLISCGIYHWYWLYKAGEKLDEARHRNGVPTGSLSIVLLLLGIFGLGIISYAIIQSEVNKYAPQN